MVYLTFRLLSFKKKLDRIRLEVTREAIERVIHKESPMTLRIQVSCDETLGIKLRDRIPEHFSMRSGEGEFRGFVYPERPLSSIYTVVPHERGYYEFEPMELELIESRGLFVCTSLEQVKTPVLVQASKRELAMARLMSRKKQFEITGKTNRRHTRTTRADFKSVREYMPGDRFRDIDWKAGSRLTKLMTKEFEIEARLPTVLLIDTSVSMKELVRKKTKLDHAIALGIQIANLLDAQGNPVGLLSFNEHRVVDFIHPGKAPLEDVMLGLFRLPNPSYSGSYPGLPADSAPPLTAQSSQFLEKVGPLLVAGRRKGLKPDTTTGIFEAVREIKKTEETGLLLVLISDLETNRFAITKALSFAIKQKHRIVVVSPFSWPYHLQGGRIDRETASRMYEDYMEKQRFLNGLRESGIRVIELSTKERGERVLASLRRMGQ
jgi:uncharacterized protein (DUF58 family)